MRISGAYEFAVANFPSMRHSIALRRKVRRVRVVVADSDGAEMKRSVVVRLKTEKSSDIQSGGAFVGDSQNFSY